VGQLLGEAVPVESVMSVKVGPLGVEGALGILVEVRDGQPTTFDQEVRQGPQQRIQVLYVVQRKMSSSLRHVSSRGLYEGLR